MPTLGWQTQRTGFSDEEEDALESEFGRPGFVPNRKKEREAEARGEPAKKAKSTKNHGGLRGAGKSPSTTKSYR